MKKGWEQKPFEDCIEHVEYTRKVQRKDFLLEGRFPVISQEAEFTNGFWDDEADLFKLLKPVVIFGDHTQVLKYVDFNFVLGADGVKILQSRSFLLPKFFFYQLQANELTSLGYARHYRLLKELVICVPPLPEQQRIVGILDEAFGGLAIAQAHAAQNLQNARDLFESHLNAVFTQRGEGWVEKTVDQVCIRLHQGLNTAGEKVKFYETGYPIIQTRNVENGVIELDTKIKLMCEGDWQRYRDKYRPEVGDVFFTNIGTIGKTAIVTDCLDYLIHWNIFKLRPRLETITSEFLKLTLDHLTQSGFFHKLQKGGTVEFVTKKMIAEASIGVPNAAQQQRIVTQLNALSAETQRLTRIYEQKLAALAELKKSLLHQAFSGEL